MRMNSGQLQINYNCAAYLLDANVYATCYNLYVRLVFSA